MEFDWFSDGYLTWAYYQEWNKNLKEKNLTETCDNSKNALEKRWNLTKTNIRELQTKQIIGELQATNITGELQTKRNHRGTPNKKVTRELQATKITGEFQTQKYHDYFQLFLKTFIRNY